MRGRWTCLLPAVAALVGCEPGSIYSPTTGGYVGARISPKSRWAVRGELSPPAAAADGNLATAARSAARYADAKLIIDLKELCVFQTIVIDHGSEQDGYCRIVSAATGIDGRQWTHRHAVGGTRRVTILSLPEVVLARYVRLKAAVPGPKRWAVAEVFIQ